MSIILFWNRKKMRIAKLFRNGRSQAVRLPKEFRFEDKWNNVIDLE